MSYDIAAGKQSSVNYGAISSFTTGTLQGFSLTLCGLRQDCYRYMEDLLAMEGCIPAGAGQQFPTGSLHQPRSTAHLLAWQRAMEAHPDGRFASFIMRGLLGGFRIGFSRTMAPQLRAASGNLASVRAHPDTVDNYLRAELEGGRLVTAPMDPRCHTSPIGLVPKGHERNEWRLIVDLSAPIGACVNEGIARELCSLHYASMDDAVVFVQHWGAGTLLAKLDLEKAYRMVPVHPDDHWLLGV